MTAPVPVTGRLTEAVPVPAASERRADPCTLVIFGASGDLTRRKLMPALFHLMHDGLLADRFAIVGIGTSLDHQAFRSRIRSGLQEFGDREPVPEDEWSRFADHLSYLTGDLTQPQTYAQLKTQVESLERTLPSGAGRLFYLAIPPSLYPDVVTALAESGLAPRLHLPQQRPWVRIIVEKPFGHSLDSARTLNAVVRRAFSEHQVYRIDHYLGKETVQNLLVFRFANSIFEPVWNRQHIDHVQITAAETVGVEHRARYYEEAGVVRDMFQNHLLQLLTLTTMEPPVTFSADAVRDEKVKVLRAIRSIAADALDDWAVRGQYGEGTIEGSRVRGYREEPGVPPQSATPTFAAVRLMVDNWRWQGVPFYLRSGKRLPRRATEIAIQFRQPPHLMFPLPAGRAIEPNTLALRLQPSEGIALRFEVKAPAVHLQMASVDMSFDYGDAFAAEHHEAYETLLLDCMLGDATLFTRSDEVEAAWAVVDPVIAGWAARPAEPFANYSAGTWGPAAADGLISRAGFRWREP